MLYGNCPECGLELKPVWFTEKEYKNVIEFLIPTGRTKKACNYLFCEMCGYKEIVDDTFDGPWK